MLIVAVQFAPLAWGGEFASTGNPSKLTMVVGPRLKTCYKHTKLLRIRAFAPISIVLFKLLDVTLQQMFQLAQSTASAYFEEKKCVSLYYIVFMYWHHWTDDVCADVLLKMFHA